MNFRQKIQISKNYLKLWRNTSFDERNKRFIQKVFFFTKLEIVLNFHYFCKVRACRISVKSSIFQKLPKIVEKHFFWWGEQTIYSKNIFFTQLEIVLNFHYFCKVRACRISVKNSNFQKLPKIVEKQLFLMKGTNNFAKKYFLSTIWDSTKFSLFL